MKSASACASRIGGRRRKKSKSPQGPSGMGVGPATPRQCRSRPIEAATSRTKGRLLVRKSYKGGRHADGTFFHCFATRPKSGAAAIAQGGAAVADVSASRGYHIGPGSGRTDE